MPKLTKKMAKTVGGSEVRDPGSGSFDPIPAGRYVGTLDVVSERENMFGEDEWNAEFTDLVNIKTGETAPGRQFFSLGLPNDEMPDDYKPRNPKKGQSTAEAWAALQEVRASVLHGFFEALGFEVDSDTEEMIGEKCIVVVGQRTAQQGAHKGERVNFVRGVAPIPEDLDLDNLGSGDDEDDDF